MKNKTDGSFSILILPGRSAQVRRLFFSEKTLRLCLSAGVSALGLVVWLLGDYLWMKSELRGAEEVRASAEAQIEQLNLLKRQATEIEELLASWKKLHSKVQASLPPQHRSGDRRSGSVEQLEQSLAALKSQLEEMIASVPSGWPAEGRVSSGLGMRRDPWTGEPEFHAGLDIPAAAGTPVYASGAGYVRLAATTDGSGRTVVLDHGQGITSHYSHLSAIRVKQGEWVRKGQHIADSGNTGKSTSPHLHFEVRVNGQPIDPRAKLIESAAPLS
jgi:murein DD-endopeptidase MepM/ murein hydrolase activator NlpD